MLVKVEDDWCYYSAVWTRSEEIYVSSGQFTSITLLGLTQKMKVISFSISCINEQYVPFSLILLFLLWWVILFLIEQSPQNHVKIHIMVHSIITHLSAKTGDCCEKQCMAGFCSVRNTAPKIQSNTQGCQWSCCIGFKGAVDQIPCLQEKQKRAS